MDPITLSPDQQTALTTILATLKSDGEAILAGAAGTGKTTVMAVVLSRWGGNVMFLAPTGKAAVRLGEQVGRKASTIHSALYGEAEEERVKGSRRDKLHFGEPTAPEGCGPGTLVVIDEASMVNENLARDVRNTILATGAALLWVGDHEQLPPVEGTWGVPLQRPTACLTQVHRQALESPVLDLATCIRERRGQEFVRWGDDCSRTVVTSVQDAVDWSEQDASNRVLLTWTNSVRTKANRMTRAARGLPRQDLVAGERIICTYNNHGLGTMNGEVFAVRSVEVCEPLTQACGSRILWVTLDENRPTPRRVLVAVETFDAYRPGMSDRRIFQWAFNKVMDRREEANVMAAMRWSVEELRRWRNEVSTSAMQATYGYCLTVHKSQGSQFPAVGFISCPNFRSFEDADFKRRLTYTAITRAQVTFRAFTLNVV